MVDTDRIVGGAKETVGKAQGAVGDATGSTRASVEGRDREGQGQVQGAYGQAKDKMREVTDEVGHYAEDVYDRVYRGGRAYLRDGRSQVEDRVGESPFLALLIAGAIGYGLALLVHGRRD